MRVAGFAIDSRATITENFAEFVASSTLADIPREVVDHAILLILDQLGCQVVGTQRPWSQAIRAALCDTNGAGKATTTYFGDHLGPEVAAFINSSFGHANELDDTHIIARTHPGSVVVPAALAAAQHDQVSDGESFLLAVILGYEIMLRISIAAMPNLMDERHHNSAPAVGPFGAAVAAGVLLRLTRGELSNALAIGGHQSAGLLQYTLGGGSVKRLQTAIASRSGLTAALLARNGITGPADVLEGSRGFFMAFTSGSDPFTALSELGSEFHLPSVGIKFHSVKYRLHSAIDLAEDLRQRVKPDDIEQVRLEFTPAGYQAIGKLAEPGDVVQAQFSAPFAVALTLAHGAERLESLTDAEVNDPTIVGLAQRVGIAVTDRGFEADWGCRLSIRLNTGDTLIASAKGPRGSHLNPATWTDVSRKFHQNVEPLLGVDCAHAIEEVVRNLPASNPLSELIPILQLPRSISGDFVEREFRHP